MSDYNAKNYTEQGGAVTHIGGKLVFDDGGSFEGLPGAVNIPASSAADVSGVVTDLNKVLVALKNAGLMAGDAWNVSVKDHTTVTWDNMPTENTESNSNHATAAISDDVITITLDCEVKDLKDCDHGSTWGTHKWFAIGVDPDTGSSVAGVVFDDGTAKVTLTADDDSEALAVGLSAGDFVLYFKAEKLKAQDARFVLSGLGKAKTAYTVKLVETKA